MQQNKRFASLIRSYADIRYYRELRRGPLRVAEVPKLLARYVQFQFLPHYFGGTPRWRVLLRRLHGERTLPDFAVLGPIKSGSSDLASYLMQHPCVLPPLTKELYTTDPGEWLPHYPTRREKERVAQRHGKALSGYFATWLHNPELVDVLHAVRPDARIVLLLRNPVDRFYSHYKWEILLAGKGAERVPHLASFETCARMAIERFPHTPMPSVAGPPLVASGIYFGSVALWRERFGPERVLIVKAEDFFTDPRSTLASVHDFLELPRVEPELAPEIINQNKLAVAPMDPESRRRLAELYAPFNQKLYDLIGRDLGWS